MLFLLRILYFETTHTHTVDGNIKATINGCFFWFFQCFGLVFVVLIFTSTVVVVAVVVAVAVVVVVVAAAVVVVVVVVVGGVVVIIIIVLAVIVDVNAYSKHQATNTALSINISNMIVAN